MRGSRDDVPRENVRSDVLRSVAFRISAQGVGRSVLRRTWRDHGGFHSFVKIKSK